MLADFSLLSPLLDAWVAYHVNNNIHFSFAKVHVLTTLRCAIHITQCCIQITALPMVVFGAIYHWFPLISGRHLNQTLGKIHFWVSFIGAYAIYFPMHYLGFIGVPRRYYEMYDSPYMTTGVGLNQFITVAALIVGFTQILFLYNNYIFIFTIIHIFPYRIFYFPLLLG